MRENRHGISRAFEFEGAVTPAEAAEALARLAEGIRARNVSLSAGANRITVRPAGDLSLAVGATEKRGKGRIEIAIAWVKSDGPGT